MYSGGKYWFIVECYLSPNNPATIERIVAPIVQRPRWDSLLVARYFNKDLAAPEGNIHIEEIAAAIVTSGL